MLSFLERLRSHPKFVEIVESIDKTRAVQCPGLGGSSSRYFTAALASEISPPILFVTPRVEESESAFDEFSYLLPGQVHFFPAWDAFAEKGEVLDHQTLHQRLSLLSRLSRGDWPLVVATSIQAILQGVTGKAAFGEGSLLLQSGKAFPREELLRFLVERGFEPVAEVELPGQFSTRGGIVDVFSLGDAAPHRLEFFGDVIESIRTFDISSQLSNAPVGSARILALTRQEIFSRATECASLLDYLPENATIVLAEVEEIQEEASNYLSQIEAGPRFTFSTIFEACRKFRILYPSTFGVSLDAPSVTWQVKLLPAFPREPAKALGELALLRAGVSRLILFCQNEGEEKRLRELLEEYEPKLLDGIEILIGPMRSGFVLADLASAIVAYDDIFHRYYERREARAFLPARPVESFLELAKGDFVVHSTHGIGRYRGMKVLEREGDKTEYLIIEYAEGSKLYVPASSIHLVQKYVGGKGSPPLDRLGGKSWEKKKKAVREGVLDFARELLTLQAERFGQAGIAYPQDTTWQHEFEASFPFQETPDQLQTIADLKRDMESARPMDRLLCGDVGYGKTEIAMRGGFKSALAGKQVAVLVPTTVLAEQHFRTFTERMADYPVAIEVLSRFKSPGKQKEVLERLAEGKIDIIIGTHRLIQSDVVFKDLGLVIIDEEQRFGVEHKERLKRLRQMVDVLTLTATPIPRTLHMALLGIRDISSLATAPQDRTRVETHVCRFDSDLFREAVLRELNRSGQVFFVHNRVYSIGSVTRELEAIVPEATVALAHGQMSEHLLEETMLRFVEGKIDVLVATTIIENGLDIPSANTLFVNEADLFGLADLHQLRGRVGRYKHRAYAYFLLPRNRPLSDIARKRLKAIEDFSELGAGFQIAIRDMEIRGAGNILGREQSGHIGAVGYDMYSRLLEAVVREVRNEPVAPEHPAHLKLDVPAYLPDEYVPSERVKLEIYRKIASVRSGSDLQTLAEEIRDRFGPLPEVAKNLLEKIEIAVLAAGGGISSIFSQDDRLVITGRDPEKLRSALSRLEEEVRFIDGQTAHVVLPRKRARGPDKSGLLAYLKKWLKQGTICGS